MNVCFLLPLIFLFSCVISATPADILESFDQLPADVAKFISNDGQVFACHASTIREQVAGELDVLLRNQEVPKSPIFVDLEGSLLKAILNFYRFGALLCPVDRVPVEACQMAFDRYLPGVRYSLPIAIAPRKASEIMIQRESWYIIVAYPARFASWMDTVCSGSTDPAVRPQTETPDSNGIVKKRVYVSSTESINSFVFLLQTAIVETAPSTYHVQRIFMTENQSKESKYWHTVYRVEEPFTME